MASVLMDISEGNENKKYLSKFIRETETKVIDLVEKEIRKLRSVKISFWLKVMFSIEREGEIRYMSHYFEQDQPHVFSEQNKEFIEHEFKKFIERAKREIEAWAAKGSGWVVERITIAYVNVACYQPLRGGTYLQ